MLRLLDAQQEKLKAEEDDSDSKDAQVGMGIVSWSGCFRKKGTPCNMWLNNEIATFIFFKFMYKL